MSADTDVFLFTRISRTNETDVALEFQVPFGFTNRIDIFGTASTMKPKSKPMPPTPTPSTPTATASPMGWKSPWGRIRPIPSTSASPSLAQPPTGPASSLRSAPAMVGGKERGMRPLSRTSRQMPRLRWMFWPSKPRFFTSVFALMVLTPFPLTTPRQATTSTAGRRCSGMVRRCRWSTARRRQGRWNLRRNIHACPGTVNGGACVSLAPLASLCHNGRTSHKDARAPASQWPARCAGHLLAGNT